MQILALKCRPGHENWQFIEKNSWACSKETELLKESQQETADLILILILLFLLIIFLILILLFLFLAIRRQARLLEPLFQSNAQAASRQIKSKRKIKSKNNAGPASLDESPSKRRLSAFRWHL
jgi:hypothetical protein